MKKRNTLTEETKEFTEEELKEQDDKWFEDAVSPEGMQRIAQGGEFLEAERADTMYSDQEATDKIIDETRKHFQDCAAIAALEHSPGLNMILKRIDEMRQLFHTDNEDMVNRDGKFDSAKMQSNIYASAKFNDLKLWIKSQMKDYKEHIKEKQDGS